jgi:hypothetical protein
MEPRMAEHNDAMDTDLHKVGKVVKILNILNRPQARAQVINFSVALVLLGVWGSLNVFLTHLKATNTERMVKRLRVFVTDRLYSLRVAGTAYGIFFVSEGSYI